MIPVASEMGFLVDQTQLAHIFFILRPNIAKILENLLLFLISKRQVW